ncbi:MAG TPA: HAD hydrolase-like protein [Chitinophagaceae bacterium]|nr:HAD hydrolase-like protein [Chitinophagaceae bacterium]
MNIFFDLDGTLIDSKPRLYYLFQHLIPESRLSYNEYWELKSRKQNHWDILSKYFKFSKLQYDEFERKWMKEIEKEEWLKFDKPLKGITDYLFSISANKKLNLFVVTSRQHKIGVVDQLSNLNLRQYFKDVLVTEQVLSKYDLISQKIKTSSEDWIVGDTGLDIITGKQLGIHTAAVLSGFLNKESLEAYNADIVVDSVLNLNF